MSKTAYTLAERKKFFNECPLTCVAEAFGIARKTVHEWVNDGCPRNPNGSFCISDVFKWRLKKETDKAESPGTLKDEKLRKEIEFLQARIEEKKDNYIERSLHETIMTSRAGSLRSFLEKTGMANAVHLAGKNVDEVRTLLFKLFQSAMNAYIGDSADG